MDSEAKEVVGMFGAVWLTVVVSVLTIMALCKIGGTWFNMPPTSQAPSSRTELVQEMYNHCLDETNGHNTQNCNEVLKELK